MAHRDNCQMMNNSMEGRLAVNDYYDTVRYHDISVQRVCVLFCFVLFSG
jgi:hypothetical protein